MQNSLEQRLVCSDFLTLYHLLVEGNLNTFFDSWVERESVDVTELSADEIIEVKTDIIIRILEQIRWRNMETELSTINENLTVGIEVESPAVFQYVLDAYSHIIKYINGYEIPYGEGERLSEVMSRLPEHLQERAKNYLAIVIDTIGDRVISETEMKEVESLRYSDRTGKSPLGRHTEFFKKISPLLVTLDGETELQFKHGFSYRSQLRELLYFHLAGELFKYWNVHETIVGVKLDVENTDIMDVTLMTIAAGFCSEKVWEDYIGQDFDDGDLFQPRVISEYIPKGVDFSNSSREHYYFPFHKPRYRAETYEMNDFDPSYSEQSYEESMQIVGVERRGLFLFLPEEFSILARHMSFTEHATLCIASLQKPEKNEVDIQLSQLWKNLQTEFGNILETLDLRLPNQDEYHITYSDWNIDQNSSSYLDNFYFYLCTQLFEEIHRDSTKDALLSETRRLIREFKKNVRRIISEG